MYVYARKKTLTPFHILHLHNTKQNPQMPKWQYRLLLSTLFLLLFSLAVLAVSSILYGFNLAFPHIQVVDINLPLPFPFADAEGAIPVNAIIHFSNPNPFQAKAKAGTIDIYTSVS